MDYKSMGQLMSVSLKVGHVGMPSCKSLLQRSDPCYVQRHNAQTIGSAVRLAGLLSPLVLLLMMTEIMTDVVCRNNAN